MKFMLKIILFSSLLFSSLLSNIDECKNDLYYANGIMMKDSKKKAKISWNIKVKTLFLNNQEAFSKLGKIDISYNTSQGLVDDVFESLEQIMSNEWGWGKFSQYYRTYMQITGFQSSVDLHRPDLTAQVNAYKQSIKDGHGVIVIAHSQGNYYTNEAYEELDSWMKDYFHMFGVATPANHVAGYAVDDATAPYVKFHNDGINIIFTALNSNRDNPNPNHNPIVSYDAHDFYDSYLTASNTKNDIFNFILQKIQAHANAPSQWQTDQEFNRNTKDYKITVEHRFDSSVIMSEEVYPFAPSKKLYRVTDNTGGNGWVKASCGGEEVFDSWEGKKDNEAYKLKGTNELIALTKLKYDIVRFLFIGILKDGRGWSEREINSVSMVLIGSINNNRTYTDDTFISGQSSSIDTIIEGSYYNDYSVYTGYTISKPYSIGSTRVLFETSDIEELKNLVDKGIPLFSTRFNFTQDMFNKLLK